MDNIFSFNDNDEKIIIPSKKRVIIGNSETADVFIEKAGVYSIHAVLEIVGNSYKIYSLTADGTLKVNGENVVAKEIKTGDKIGLGEATFVFGSSLPDVVKQEIKENKLPVMPTFENTVSHEGVQSNYPLDSDSRYTYSEYIFEEADEVYPIFKYSIDKEAVEIIVLFKGRIISVDYLSKKIQNFFLSGSESGDNSVEFPYLGKTEKVQVISKQGEDTFLHKLPGFKHRSFTEKDSSGEMFLLERDDIHLFEKDDLQVFVRGDEAPPLVKSAPVMRRDPEFKKYLIICFLFMGAIFALLSRYEVDPELEKEKAPERIAKILYKPKKLNITKKKTFVKKKEKKKVVRKAPTKPAITKKQKNTKVVKTKGDPNKKGNNVAKKGNPKKGPKNNKKVVRTSNKKAGKAGRTSQKVSKVKRRAVNKKFKGKVDTYKTTDFTSSINTLMAKGGTLSSFTAKTGTSESFADSSALSQSESAQVERSNVATKVGSLSGATTGKLESSYGTNGLVQKKQVYIAGVPYKEIILGSIDRNDILRILLENVPQFRYCYQKELDVKQKGLDGVVSLKFVIGASGHVTRASVKSANNGVPGSVTGCIVSHLKTIQFPRPKGGGQVSVNTPLNLQSKTY